MMKNVSVDIVNLMIFNDLKDFDRIKHNYFLKMSLK